MTNPSPYEAFPEPPEATYNNPAISYNERCLTYNGEWNLECLYGIVSRKKGGRSGARAVFKSKPKQYPDKDFIELLFNVHITKDDEKISSETKRYRFPKVEKNINIAAEKIYEIATAVSVDELENKNEPPNESLEASVTSLLNEIKEDAKLSVSSSVEKLHYLPHMANNIFVSGQINKILSRDINIPKISSIVEKAVFRSPIASVNSSLDKQVIIKTVFVDAETKFLRIKEIKITGILEWHLSPRILRSLVLNKMTKPLSKG